jgi:arylsulfatase A-like enzyme
MTDQHNFRTIGCYREYLIAKNQTDQAFIWGPNVAVETPHIDRLAKEGALFTNFHATAPLCTPNRGSFVSGLYPAFTGADRNHKIMDETVVTFAQVLKEKEGYDTAYFGKWHLNGKIVPGFGDDSPSRNFGFNNIKYLFNQGHWKFIEEADDGHMKAYTYKDGKEKFAGNETKHFMTDYLFDQGIDFIEQNRNEAKKPFLAFLSIPDPHPPKEVRPPYDTMYDHLNFTLPYTAKAAARFDPVAPAWSWNDFMTTPSNETEKHLEDYQNRDFYQKSMRTYFGMVKCIDDNIGKLLSYLDDAGLDENTVIAFTSDHGDLLSEHARFNKNRPYRTSAGIPFIIRHPQGIKAGKIVETAYTSVDFAPTILSYLGTNNHNVNFQGVDFSDELFSKEMISRKDVIRYVFDSGKRKKWAAAVMNQYRLIVSDKEVPFLFDLDRDPNELNNFFDKTSGNVQQLLQDSLYEVMFKYQIPLSKRKRIVWSLPACADTGNRFLVNNKFNATCRDFKKEKKFRHKCNKKKFKGYCPVTCGSCCNDSSGVMWTRGRLLTCNEMFLNKQCSLKQVKEFCPVTCGQCGTKNTPS